MEKEEKKRQSIRLSFSWPQCTKGSLVPQVYQSVTKRWRPWHCVWVNSLNRQHQARPAVVFHLPLRQEAWFSVFSCCQFSFMLSCLLCDLLFFNVCQVLYLQNYLWTWFRGSDDVAFLQGRFVFGRYLGASKIGDHLSPISELEKIWSWAAAPVNTCFFLINSYSYGVALWFVSKGRRLS